MPLESRHSKPQSASSHSSRLRLVAIQSVLAVVYLDNVHLWEILRSVWVKYEIGGVGLKYLGGG